MKGQEDIEGLIALRPDSTASAVYLELGNAAPHNQKGKAGEKKRYDGVGGHLFAIAARRSVEEGYGGIIYGDAANEDVLRAFVERYGATPLPTRKYPLRFMIDGDALLQILNTYNFDEWSE